MSCLQKWWTQCKTQSKTFYVDSQFFWRAQQRAKWYIITDLQNHARKHGPKQEKNCEVCLAHLIKTTNLQHKHISDEDYKKLDATINIEVKWKPKYPLTQYRFELHIENINEDIMFDYFPMTDNIAQIIDELLTSFPNIPKSNRKTLIEKINNKINEINNCLNNKTKKQELIIQIEHNNTNITHHIEHKNIGEFINFTNDNIQPKNNYLTIDSETMLQYLNFKWTIYKNNISNVHSAVQIMWNRLPTELIYDWVSNLPDDDYIFITNAATPKVRKELIDIGFNLNIEEQLINHIIEESLRENNNNNNEHILDYASMQSLIDTKPDTAQLQMHENYFPGADLADELYTEAINNWNKHTKTENNNEKII